MLATLPDSTTRHFTAHGLNGELGLGGQRFHYWARAREGSAGDLRLARFCARGDGDRGTTRLSEGALAYRGGTIRARGTYRERGEQLAIQVVAQNVPVEDLAARMGVSTGWLLAGRVTGTIRIDAGSGAIRRVRGQLVADAGELRAAGMSREFRWDTASAALDW